MFSSPVVVVVNVFKFVVDPAFGFVFVGIVTVLDGWVAVTVMVELDSPVDGFVKEQDVFGIPLLTSAAFVIPSLRTGAFEMGFSALRELEVARDIIVLNSQS